jgi:2-polyprenyl-6-methoxyphenol hydroxylase-like FAD-dependent oxidoreductase
MGSPGFQVDRSRFDEILLQGACETGTVALQPAHVVEICRRNPGGWRIVASSENGPSTIESLFLVDATGRSGILCGNKRRTGTPTLALYAYWKSSPAAGNETRIEAGDNHWFWGAPLPNGQFNATVFIDPSNYAQGVSQAGGRESFYRQLLKNSELLADCLLGTLSSPVSVCDATCIADENPVTPDSIKVGEASFSIDPLSSQGVTSAIGSALHAAAVVHTILRRPENTEPALRFYRDRQRESVALHAKAAGEFYHEAAESRPGEFWRRRARLAPRIRPERPATRPAFGPQTLIQLSPEARMDAVLTIRDDFVVATQAIFAPNIARPVALLNDIEIVPLIASLQAAVTVSQLMKTWSRQLSEERALAVFCWLWEAGILATTTRMKETRCRPFGSPSTGM